MSRRRNRLSDDKYGSRIQIFVGKNHSCVWNRKATPYLNCDDDVINFSIWIIWNLFFLSLLSQLFSPHFPSFFHFFFLLFIFCSSFSSFLVLFFLFSFTPFYVLFFLKNVSPLFSFLCFSFLFFHSVLLFSLSPTNSTFFKLWCMIWISSFFYSLFHYCLQSPSIPPTPFLKIFYLIFRILFGHHFFLSFPSCNVFII